MFPPETAAMSYRLVSHLPRENVQQVEKFLSDLPQIINKIFDVLDLLVVRAILFGLILLGAYTLFKHHS